MTNSGTAAKEHVARMTAVYEQIAELTTDIKELKLAAKADDLDAAMLARWAKAIAVGKASKLAKQTADMHDLGEQLVPDLFGHAPVAPVGGKK